MKINIIKDYLANPNGRYADGLAIFTQLASIEIKKKYLPFFKEVDAPELVSEHDMHNTMLINKVSDILHKMKVNPSLYENIDLIIKDNGIDAETQALIDLKNQKIASLKLKLSNLKSDNEQLLNENSDLEDTIEELESELSDANESIEDFEIQISNLEIEINELKTKRGLSIVSVKDMPENIRKKYERNQQITPIMGKLHAEMSVENLPVKVRKKLVTDLIKFDDERRQNWDDIESWSEGRDTEDFSNDTPDYDDDPTVAGAQMARRIERIKENMSRSQIVADTTEKETIKTNALKRIEAYKEELIELNKKIQPVLSEVKNNNAE